MLAPCGLICTDCDVYKAAQDPEKAKQLAIEGRQHGCTDVTPEWFKCRGCHGADEFVWGDDCEIRICCIKTKNLDNCSLCDDFPCQLILDFENDKYEHHTKAVTYLRELRDSKN